LLNAANEVAVAAFLGGRLNFTAIAVVIERVLEQLAAGPGASLEEVMAADGEARRVAVELVDGDAGGVT
jgi:1-deoxy-D-xylulose-5-phosphate reductoisomerase